MFAYRRAPYGVHPNADRFATRVHLLNRLQCARDRRVRREVTTHRVQRDTRQGYASLAATRCSSR